MFLLFSKNYEKYLIRSINICRIYLKVFSSGKINIIIAYLVDFLIIIEYDKYSIICIYNLGMFRIRWLSKRYYKHVIAPPMY